MAEIDSYLREIKHFREKYAGVIDIQAGFEMEFSQREKMGAKNNGVNHFEDLQDIDLLKKCRTGFEDLVVDLQGNANLLRNIDLPRNISTSTIQKMSLD